VRSRRLQSGATTCDLSNRPLGLKNTKRFSDFHDYRNEPQATISKRGPMKLSIISPTYNESENVGLLVAEIEKSLNGADYEILISDDDSPDLTWARVEEIGRRNPRVRVLRRTSNRGLGPSVVDGFSAATGEFVACIDADLQHDPKVLPQMLKEVSAGSTLVVATRYMPGGGTANWNAIRRLGSWGCTKLAQWMLGVELRDPMSGYFMMRRDDFMKIRDRLNARGFKILLEIAAHMQPCHLREVPYTFGPRARGESKLTNKIISRICCNCGGFIREIVTRRAIQAVSWWELSVKPAFEISVPPV